MSEHTEQELEQLKDEIKAAIAELDKFTVHFHKSDGTIRIMKATRNLDLVPADKLPSGEVEVINDTACRVFDLEKNEWRSFRYDTVIAIYPGV